MKLHINKTEVCQCQDEGVLAIRANVIPGFDPKKHELYLCRECGGVKGVKRRGGDKHAR